MRKAREQGVAGSTVMTETEALRFGKLDSDIRFYLLTSRVVDLEIDILNRNYLAKKTELENSRQLAKKTVDGLQPQYTATIKELAEKYKLDPQKMVIDPDSRIIREL